MLMQVRVLERDGIEPDNSNNKKKKKSLKSHEFSVRFLI